MISKGIILVDDIPVICAECNLASLKNNGGNIWCGVKQKFCYNAKPKWCPIRPIPEKKPLTGDVSNQEKIGQELVRVGYNSCIDEILKGVGENE